MKRCSAQSHYVSPGSMTSGVKRQILLFNPIKSNITSSMLSRWDWRPRDSTHLLCQEAQYLWIGCPRSFGKFLDKKPLDHSNHDSCWPFLWDYQSAAALRILRHQRRDGVLRGWNFFGGLHNRALVDDLRPAATSEQTCGDQYCYRAFCWVPTPCWPTTCLSARDPISTRS